MFKKKITFIILILFTVMPRIQFAQEIHIKNLLKCGLPKVDDYKCFGYYQISSSTVPYEIPLSKSYNRIIPSQILYEAAKGLGTVSFLVIKDDTLVYENYLAGFERKSKVNSFSMAKTITSLLVGIAIDKGYITSLDDKVYKYLPQFSQGKDTLLTIRHLASMASGLNWSENFESPRSDVVKAYYGYPLDSLIAKTHVVKTPGKKWKYQCGNFILLGMIIEKASGMKLTDFTQKYLWEPLGANYSVYWGADTNSGIVKSFCCFYASPYDFALLGLLVLHKGNFNGKQIVPAWYIEQMMQPDHSINYKLLRKNDFYSLGLWTYPRKKYKAHYFAGTYGQYIFVLPEQNAVVVRNGRLPNQLDVYRLPPDVELYLKLGYDILEKYKDIKLRASKGE